jgi:hypothetical protein
MERFDHIGEPTGDVAGLTIRLAAWELPASERQSPGGAPPVPRLSLRGGRKA